ncbi:transglycosylase SLT domain-containing protein [Miltoncostaea marina]|uniref:transglycosylase SLT domain-containing protein n=1 Tax=Miltoncostaea marina TaxID=2843215 RepID=UPI001C3D60DA|nr:transglycosylase SLT domain-containing protein [Miltoncostaea marina]
MRRNHQGGAATPLVLALAALLLAGAVGAFALGRAQLAAARAQTAADLAALSAARALRAELGRAAADGPGTAAALRRRLWAAAADAATGSGARLERLSLPGAAWPPVAVEVVVGAPGPAGTRARAVARAGLVVAGTLGDGRTGRAGGGGYAGPLVYRDGRPVCPAVAAAFDLMDAAARADGVDLVVTSGFRSDAEQAVLFRRHPDPRWVAPPGRSRHRDATELDLNMAGGGAAHAWLARNGARFGFAQRYSWEPWHWGYLPGCGAGAAAGPRGDDAASAAGAAGALPAWVPAPYREPVLRAAMAHGLQPALLAALLRAESGFDPRAVSAAGARGIAQFMPATASGMGLRDPFDPAQAIPAAARLLAGHVRAFGSVPLALAAYNAGPGAVRRHGGVPPYPETQAYVARVLALAGGVAALGGGPHGDGVRLIRVDGRFV